MSSSSQGIVRVCIFPDTDFSRFLFSHSFNFLYFFWLFDFLLAPPSPLFSNRSFQIFQNISRCRLKVYSFRPLTHAPQPPFPHSVILKYSRIYLAVVSKYIPFAPSPSLLISPPPRIFHQPRLSISDVYTSTTLSTFIFLSYILIFRRPIHLHPSPIKSFSNISK